MLLEFGARNFFSFDEGFILSLRLNKKCPETISRGKEYTKILCVKGSNGSGKTNVLKAISFVSDFCRNSFKLEPNDKIDNMPFFYNDEPSEFFIVFKIDDIEYRYELEVSNDQVITETIFQKKLRYVKVFERKLSSIVKISNQYSDLKTIKIRNNASIISTAHQYEIKSLSKIYTFFSSIISNVNIWGLKNIGQDIDSVSKLFFNNKEVFKFVIEIIKKCDLGIKDIKIMDRDDEKGKKNYFPVFYHELKNTTKMLTIHFQSSGTKALYRILALYKFALLSGGVLVLDEFDINLHPHILPLLIELFENEELNKFNSQLIFTTHNLAIMNKLGKYRTLIVNKKKNSSYVYRLDELPGDIVRNDRQISPVYESGKIGGVPKI